MKRHEIDMLNGPLCPKLFTFAIPLMISSMLQLAFNSVDIIVVGRFAGDASLAAVTSTGSLASLLINVFMGLSVGTNVVVAQAMGHGDRDRTERVVHTSILTSLVGGVLLALLGLFLSRPLLELMGSPAEVMDLSTLYLKIYFLGAPAGLAYNFGAALLRAGGDTQRPMVYLSLGGVINLVLNLITVIVFDMGVAGVAIATVISQVVSAALVLWCLMKEEGALHLDWKRLAIDKTIFFNIVRVGLPAGCQGIVFSLSNVVIQSSINSFGQTVMSGNGAAANIEGFVGIGINAFYQANLTFTSQNYGAGKLDRVDQVFGWTMLMGTVSALLMSGLAYLFGPQLLGIYSSNPDVIQMGMIRVIYVILPLFLNGMVDIVVGSLRGLGWSMAPMIVSVVGICGVRLVWIATVFQSVRTLECLYLSYPISWTITFLCHTACFLFLRHRVRSKASAYVTAANRA